MHPYFVGLDVHQQGIAYCVKTAEGEIVREGKIPATRNALDQWVKTLPGPWHGGMEATLFSHWIFRHLQPHAARLEMGHPARMSCGSAGWWWRKRCAARIKPRACRWRPESNRSAAVCTGSAISPA